VTVRVSAIGHPGIGVPREISLIRFGEVIRSQSAQDPHEVERFYRDLLERSRE